MTLLLPDTVTQQPQLPTGIDWGNPITRGLFVAYLPNPAYDAVANKPFLSVGGLGRITGPREMAHGTDGSSTYLWCDVLPHNSQVDCTIFALLQSSGTVVSDRRAFSAADSGDNATVFAIAAGTPTSTKLTVWCRDAANNAATSSQTSASVFDGTPHAAAITVSGTALSSYVDGVPDTTTTMSFNTGLNLNRVSVGALYRTAVGNFFAGGVFVGLVWSRSLSAAEHKELAYNPWQVFSPHRALWVPSAVTAGFIPLIGRGPGMALAGNGGLASRRAA